MNQLHVTTRAKWRAWLRKHHADTSEVWVVFDKKHTGKPALPYDDAVEEALCFGWIDSLMRRLDDDRYARKFTPRTANSRWSQLNRQRAERMIEAGKMASAGLAAVEAARASGAWELLEGTQPTDVAMPDELQTALASDAAARKAFEALTPSKRRNLALWIGSAKKQETRGRRAAQAVEMLKSGDSPI